MFQFQTGSIKSTFPVGTIHANIKFQFQTGSIKSSFAFSNKVGSFTFQFQTGSIKSQNAARRFTIPDSRFQFPFGSIKRLTVKPWLAAAFPFQFQTGSIKRLCESHTYIIQNPDRTCQVNFDCPHFLGSSAVNLRSCTFAGEIDCDCQGVRFGSVSLKKREGTPRLKPAFHRDRQQICDLQSGRSEKKLEIPFRDGILHRGVKVLQ